MSILTVELGGQLVDSVQVPDGEEKHFRQVLEHAADAERAFVLERAIIAAKEYRIDADESFRRNQTIEGIEKRAKAQALEDFAFDIENPDG